LKVLSVTPQAPMAGRWELTEEQWTLVEPVLHKTRRADSRGTQQDHELSDQAASPSR